MKKSNLMPSLILGCICLVAALLLSVVNKFTAPIIAKRQSDKALASFTEVLPGATGKEDLTLNSSYPASVKAGYKFENGFVFQMEVTGKDSGFIIMVGVDLDGKVTGAKVIENKETPSYFETVFIDNSSADHTYTGVDLGSFEPQLVAGATLTSKAYSEAVKAALQSYVIACGGSVDVRTDEQKHSDALNFALGTTGKNLENWFGVGEIAGVSAIYTTDTGVVIILGDNYVGFDTEGNIVKTATMDSTAPSDVDDTLRAQAEAAYDSYQTALNSSIVIDERYPSIVKSGSKLSTGYVFTMEVTGKEAGLIIQVTVGLDGKVVSTKVIESNETPGYAANVFPNVEGTNGVYTGMSLSDFDHYLVGGATLTSRAYGDAVNAALQAFVVAEGGSVDVRTDEQKHNDALNFALGTTGKTFERWLATEKITGVDRIYTSDAGIVVIIGDTYIGVGTDGQAVNSATKESTEAGAVSAEHESAAEAAYSVYATTLVAGYKTQLDKPSGTSARVKEIYVTTTGNYIFYVEAVGYSMDSDYDAYDEYIKLAVCISADGKIIDVQTISHKETEGLGAICGSDAYTDQFKGAGEDDIENLGIISGATITTDGYQKALERAFTAFEKLTEGGNG